MGYLPHKLEQMTLGFYSYTANLLLQLDNLSKRPYIQFYSLEFFYRSIFKLRIPRRLEF